MKHLLIIISAITLASSAFARGHAGGGYSPSYHSTSHSSYHYHYNPFNPTSY